MKGEEMIEIDTEKTAENIKKAFSKSGKSRFEIAESLDCSIAVFYYWLVGRSLPTLQNFFNLCDILNVEPYDILVFKKEDENI